MRPSHDNFTKAAAILGIPTADLIQSFDNMPKPLSGPAGEGELCAVMDDDDDQAVNLNALRRMARRVLDKYDVTPKSA